MYKTITSEADICSDADQACNNGPVHNLILKHEFDISLARNPFKGVFREIATAWQAELQPDFLYINHGQYIHRSGNGIDHIIKELQSRPDSNRAMCCLISMQDIIKTADLPIPSLISVQFGITGQTLYCTAYFRALEVARFLPINIAEFCLIIESIFHKIQHLEKVRLCIHAFRAYKKREFDCLEKPLLDRQNRGVVAASLFSGDRNLIRTWISGKLKDSSVIETSGLSEIVNALETGQGQLSKTFSPAFTASLKNALVELEELKALRTTSSHSAAIDELTVRFHNSLERALREL